LLLEQTATQRKLPPSRILFSSYGYMVIKRG
jgi:hypothetical protein